MLIELFVLAGDHVLAYWWGRWWRGKVHRVALRDSSLTIRFEWSNKDVSGYKPRCVHKLEVEPE